MAAPDPRHEELSAALSARKELGDEYDRAFVEGVVERLGKEIDERVDARLEEIGGRRKRPRRGGGGSGLATLSLIFGIPITAIAGGEAHLAGIAVAWGGIVLVNLANALRREPPPHR